MIEGGLFYRILKRIKERKDKIRNGGINSIPSPLTRFSNDFIGIEQQKYYIVTANTKVGKTQIANWLFLYTSILYAYEHPDQIRLKVFYYPLEESKEEVALRFLSFALFRLKGIRQAPVDLLSSRNIELSDEIYKILKEHPELDKLSEFYETHVEFSSSRNPTGVYNEVKAFMEENGTVHKKKQKVTENGVTKEVDVFDFYEPNDKDLYTLVLFDHVSLVQLERSLTLKQSADKLSEYFVLLRNRYGVTPILVQQQVSDKEGLDAFKERKLEPDANGVADTKYTVRDCNCLIGLYSPARHDIPEYWGYDITKLRDNCRFLKVIVNRGMPAGGVIGLFFDGATCTFSELPRPDSPEMNKVYQYIDKVINKLINNLIN